MELHFASKDPELLLLIKRLEDEGEVRILRLFACWCARQLPSYTAEDVELIDTAEKLADGIIDENQAKLIRASFDRMGRMTAAGTIGLRHKSRKAAALLGIYTTLHPNAATAAESASIFQRNYEVWTALENGVSQEEIEEADHLLASRQVHQLEQMLQNKRNDIAGNMVKE